MRLPTFEFSLLRPTLWDVLAVVVVLAGTCVGALNWILATSPGPDDAMPDGTALLFVVTQLTLCVTGLAVLGKTVHHGTVLGHLAAVTGSLVGLGGSLLATVLWTAA